MVVDQVCIDGVGVFLLNDDAVAVFIDFDMSLVVHKPDMDNNSAEPIRHKVVDLLKNLNTKIDSDKLRLIGVGNDY